MMNSNCVSMQVYTFLTQPSLREVADSIVQPQISEWILGVNSGCHFSVNFRIDTLYHTMWWLYTPHVDKMYMYMYSWHTYNKLCAHHRCELDFPVHASSTLMWTSTVYTDTIHVHVDSPKEKHYNYREVYNGMLLKLITLDMNLPYIQYICLVIKTKPCSQHWWPGDLLL